MSDDLEERLIEEKIRSLALRGEVKQYEDKRVASLQGSFSNYDSRVLKTYCLMYTKFIDESEGFELYTSGYEFDVNSIVIIGPMRIWYGRNFEKNGRRRFTGNTVVCDDYTWHIIGFIEKYWREVK